MGDCNKYAVNTLKKLSVTACNLFQMSYMLVIEREENKMSIRRMEYKKNGYDIRCRVEGSGEYAEGLILWKSYGDDKYIVIGKIYKTNLASRQRRKPNHQKILARSRQRSLCCLP
jgi:hypothetical protein